MSAPFSITEATTTVGEVQPGIATTPGFTATTSPQATMSSRPSPPGSDQDHQLRILTELERQYGIMSIQDDPNVTLEERKRRIRERRDHLL
ncbi:hypothetical protein CF327_g3710 [Tilletia walkeri]|uniref:Uncharacterized protein n=1 Tax=Tilletia walkeri TaxID=117179 RepID=A0A8X7NAR6_9BASI|nr:hypothetical protein CF327_g3710 [Tilletia walkeri]KAE8269824.1 hypothetical protein A4X09_0g2523 [Tilletia walkeri]